MNQNSFRENQQIHFEMQLESVALASTSELKKQTACIYLNSSFNFVTFSSTLHADTYQDTFLTACPNFVRNPPCWLNWSQHSLVEFEMDWLCLLSQMEKWWKVFRTLFKQNQAECWRSIKQQTWKRLFILITEAIEWDVLVSAEIKTSGDKVIDKVHDCKSNYLYPEMSF